MHSDLAEVIPGIGKLKGSEDVKKGLLQEEDPLLVEKATLPTGVFAMHIFGCQNLYLDANFPPEHFRIYVQITVGSITKCTSLQSPFKKGRVVWDEIKNFSVTISPKVTSSVNKVAIAVFGFDKLQPIPKHKLLGKTDFHLHKLAKKQWSMETFELQNRKKQYAGDLQLELAFAYGLYGYGLSEQLESHHLPRYYVQQSAFPHMELTTSTSGNSSGITFVSKKVPHPNIITFKEKMTSLEPEFSPYYSKLSFTPIDGKSRPLLQQKMTRLNQLYCDYSQLTTRSKRVNYIKRLLQEKDMHGTIAGDQDSDTEGSSEENLGDVTQFGLTGALAQMANLTFMAGAPELIQMTDGPSVVAVPSTETDEQLRKEKTGVELEVPVLPDLLQQGKLVLPSSLDGGETSGESSQAQQAEGQVRVKPDDDGDDDDDADDDADMIMAAMAARGRRSAVIAPKPSQKRKSLSIEKQTTP